MTGLLVSVRDIAEARIALEHGVDIIDVKEPHRGSLGAADAGTINMIGELLRGQRVLSVAMGELLDENSLRSDDVSVDVTYAKMGLAGCALVNDWQQRWGMHIDALPTHVSPVAVAYADWRTSKTPSPAEILVVGRELGCRTLLIDTYDKSLGTLFDVLGQDEARQIVRDGHAIDVQVVLAGSLTPETIPIARGTGADYVAVRGAVCDGTRTSGICGGRVAAIATLLRDGVAANQL